MARKRDSDKVMDAILTNIEGLDVFRRIRCVGQDNECPNDVVMITLVRATETTIGGYCFGHLKLLSAYTDLGDEE